jgi:hypothetical protein
MLSSNEKGIKSLKSEINMNINRNNANTNSKNSKETKPSYSMSNTHNQGRLISGKEKSVLAFPPNNMNVKVNLINQNINDRPYKLVDHNGYAADTSISKLNNNIKMNSNNITKINLINNRYIDNNSIKDRNTYHPNNFAKSECDNSKSFRSNGKKYTENKFTYREEEEMILKAKIWDNLSIEMDLAFPALLYKLVFKFEEKSAQNEKKNMNKFLSNNYSFYKIDTVKDWKSNMEMLLNDIITTDSSEIILIHSYLMLFVHAFFIENDISTCKEILYKIKENTKSLLYQKFEWLSVINLLEGLIVERKNYIECEEFYSKCLIYGLLLFGEPRGKGNYGNNFLLFPLWKIARQTCILENSLTNENFKEMFHSQDYVYKCMIENTNLNKQNNLYDENIKYSTEINTRKKTPINLKLKKLEIMKNRNLNISDIIFDEDINEGEIEDDSNLYVSENNFEFIYKLKYFPFPSISDIKTTYNEYFNSENFISFILKNLLSFNNWNQYNLYEEDVLNKLGLNCYSSTNNNSIEISSKTHIPTGSSYKSGISKKDKTAIFSIFMYEFLLDKLNYKKCPPDSAILSWGNNCHNETTHNVIY